MEGGEFGMEQREGGGRRWDWQGRRGWYWNGDGMVERGGWHITEGKGIVGLHGIVEGVQGGSHERQRVWGGRGWDETVS